MAERQYRTLTKRTVDRLAVNGKDAVFWDNELPGFGVRVYPSGKKVFVVQTRALPRCRPPATMPGNAGSAGRNAHHAQALKVHPQQLAQRRTRAQPAP